MVNHKEIGEFSELHKPFEDLKAATPLFTMRWQYIPA